MLPVLVAALAFTPAAHAGGPTMTIGAVEQQVAQPTLVAAKAKLDLAKLGGLQAVRVSESWSRGQVEPPAEDVTALQNVTGAAQLDGMTVYLQVSWFSRNTPLTTEDRDQFAQFIQTLAADLPTVTHITVGNEPNLNLFWLPQFGADGEDMAAQGYEQLLAVAYDALKAVSSKIVVIGGAVSPRGNDKPNGTRLTHSPTTFIPDLGAAYRQSGRTEPIMDWFAFHPYEETSSVPPTATHNTTTVAIADYAKLVGLLGTAFDGTAQLGSKIPIVYDEFGVESQIPAGKAAHYKGVEPATTKPVSEATQGLYYRQAMQIAFCQPTVVGFFLFHAFDEDDLDRWQSGLYYADFTPKADLRLVRNSASESRRGILTRCSGLGLTPRVKRLSFPRGSGLALPRMRLSLSCDIDCAYVARLERFPSHKTVVGTRGTAIGQTLTQIFLPPASLGAGRYRFTIRLVAPVNPAKPVVAASKTFRVGRTPAARVP
jgi:hypothetical protein